MQALLKVRDVHKSYNNSEIIKGISFDLNPGETKVIIGPSGTGKSTLLRCINHLIRPDSGTILLNNTEITDPKVDINKVRLKIGMVFQHFNLFTHLTALNNVQIGLTKVKGMKKRAAAEKAMEELKRVGLADKASSYPAELSGGQQQRIAIARALAMEPVLMLFDEATSALDPELIGEVLNVMAELAKSGLSMLIVTHEMGFARSVSDEILFLDNGTILEKGLPSQFFSHPKELRTQQFLHKLSELYGEKQEIA